MLKYIIALCIISFSNSSLRTVGSYYELIFSQRSAVSAFYNLKNDLQNTGKNTDEVKEYLKTNATSLIAISSKKWIVYLLGSLDSEGRWFVDCQDEKGNTLQYERMMPTETFRNELKKYWPSANLNFTDDQVWKANFDFTGCCVNATPIEYFQNAVKLYHNFNIGRMLERFAIIPGNTYRLDSIIKSIGLSAGRRPYVKCISPKDLKIKDNKFQYLLEIQICLNRGYQTIDCAHKTSNLCETNILVYYPIWNINHL